MEKKWKISPKTQEKTQNSKKKLKTQGKNSMSRRTCPLPPSQVMLKKKPEVHIHALWVMVMVSDAIPVLELKGI